MGVATQHATTRLCGIVLRSEAHLHGDREIMQMQTMMATILQARYATSSMMAQPPAPPDDADDGAYDAHDTDDLNGSDFRPHDLEHHVHANGSEEYCCRRCWAFRAGTSQTLAQQHCNGRRRVHRRFAARGSAMRKGKHGPRRENKTGGGATHRSNIIAPRERERE